MLHLEREARDWSAYNEYSYRIMLLLQYVYCSRAHPISILNFGGVACRICSPLAQTHQSLGGKAIYFFYRKAVFGSVFLQTL